MGQRAGTAAAGTGDALDPRQAVKSPHFGPWWSPRTWVCMVRWKWRSQGALSNEEARGFKFWAPVGLAIGAVELAGALSGTFRNRIPWPTISSTIGHIEELASWVSVIVVALIAMIAFQALAERRSTRRAAGDRAAQASASSPGPPPIRVGSGRLTFRYGVPTVLIATALTALVVRAWSDDKYALGYAIYGAFAIFGVVVPSALSRWANTTVHFPSVFRAIDALSDRFRSTPMILVAGLSILVVHLALYPWPDITREPARYAGLTASKARSKARQELQRLHSPKAGLTFSTQSRGVFEGRDAWLVYFTGAAATFSGCVVVVTDTSVQPSPDCSD